jgi:hypothetical protein
MRILLLLSLLLAGVPGVLAQAPAQAPATQTKPPAPAKPQPTPPPAQPAAPQTPRRAPQPAAGRSGMAITVTDMKGSTIPDVHVEVMGPTARMGETNGSGQINFPGLQTGTYRLRFTGDEVTPFEREVTLRAGQIADVDVTLNPAPPPKVISVPAEPAPAAPAPAANNMGPAGQPHTLSIVDLLEKEFIGRQPRRESLLACSGRLRTTMIQLNDPQPERLYADEEATYYVLAGEGTLRLNGRETRLETNGFVSVPRGTTHSFARRGNRPFVLLATLSGEPCEQPR